MSFIRLRIHTWKAGLESWREQSYASDLLATKPTIKGLFFATLQSQLGVLYPGWEQLRQESPFHVKVSKPSYGGESCSNQSWCYCGLHFISALHVSYPFISALIYPLIFNLSAFRLRRSEYILILPFFARPIMIPCWNSPSCLRRSSPTYLVIWILIFLCMKVRATGSYNSVLTKS